jgi:hypothetical protein
LLRVGQSGRSEEAYQPTHRLVCVSPLPRLAPQHVPVVVFWLRQVRMNTHGCRFFLLTGVLWALGIAYLYNYALFCSWSLQSGS